MLLKILALFSPRHGAAPLSKKIHADRENSEFDDYEKFNWIF